MSPSASVRAPAWPSASQSCRSFSSRYWLGETRSTTPRPRWRDMRNAGATRRRFFARGSFTTTPNDGTGLHSPDAARQLQDVNFIARAEIIGASNVYRGAGATRCVPGKAEFVEHFSLDFAI